MKLDAGRITRQKDQSIMVDPKANQACALIVARAIAPTRKFGATEHEKVLKELDELRDAHPEFAADIREWNVYLGNRSAATKDLAKAGLVSEGDPSARARAVTTALDEVAEAAAKAAKEFEK